MPQNLTPEEIKEKFKKLSQEEGYINSIFNYCDRWCERCHFTSKCRNFAVHDNNMDIDDFTNERFKDYLSNIFKATYQLLEEEMIRAGINLDELEEIEPIKNLNPREDPLYLHVLNLSKKVHSWLQEKEELINEKAHEEFIVDENLSGNFRDAIEVIQWYNFFIPAKIQRALPHSPEDLTDEYFKYDSDGSAKIALIAIENSIAAWGMLLDKLKEEEDTILNFLAELSKAKKWTEKCFPEAHKFIRPGFDE